MKQFTVTAITMAFILLIDAAILALIYIVAAFFGYQFVDTLGRFVAESMVVFLAIKGFFHMFKQTYEL